MINLLMVGLADANWTFIYVAALRLLTRYQGRGNEEASGCLSKFDVGCIYDVYFHSPKA
jgi:hypothetical protein